MNKGDSVEKTMNFTFAKTIKVNWLPFLSCYHFKKNQYEIQFINLFACGS
jgi:hypothetical protein